ncbi:cinnamoyl-CoA reductase [Hypoxylon sp. EC38]|nr:cinnamoyl-CoA reductase [Hypoxylon sp. EC38]
MAATILITGASGLIGFRILLGALAAGYNVRYTLALGDRLSSIIIPDFGSDGAFDSALEGVTYIIHAGSPVPVPTYDPTTEVFQPTVKITSGLLCSALKTPSVQRVIITSSIVANLGLTPPPFPVTASTRVPLPKPIPSTFSSLFEAYITGKIVELHKTDEFVKTRNPHFTVSHVFPGYVFGRNELALDATAMQTQNSSNNLLMMGMVGGEWPFPIDGGFVHIDDLADLHLRNLFLESKKGESEDFGIATKVDFGTIFDHVEKAFPEAVKAGVFKRGNVPTLPLNYKSSDVERLLGRKLKTFESAVVDVAGQYLEKLGKEKA